MENLAIYNVVIGKKFVVLLVLLAAMVAVPAFSEPGGSESTISREAFEAAQPPAEEGALPRIDNGDGTWSYLPSLELDSETRVVGAIVTWRYDGQARFAYEPEPVEGSRSWISDGDLSIKPAAEQLSSMVRIDRWGRRWRAESADVDAWASAIEAYDEGSAEKPSSLEERAHEERVHEEHPKAGTVVEWQPMSWTSNNCYGGPAKEELLWEGESRTQVVTPDRWESSAVRVLRSDGSRCSGVAVDQDLILTSAHCVSDHRNDPIPVGDVRICRTDLWNRCQTASNIHVPDSYTGGSGGGGGTDLNDDWALIELPDTWAQTGAWPAHTMRLSGASDARLDSLNRVNNLGTPGWTHNCTYRDAWPVFHNDEAEPVAATFRKRVSLKIDTGPGHSGGPIYYCPGGSSMDTCEGGDTAYVFGVSAGWNTVSKRAAGPKVPYFRDAALALLSD